MSIDYLQGEGQNLWNRAKKSSQEEICCFLKDQKCFSKLLALYFSKARGCNVWDLDNRKLIDLSIMGIGTNILGYGNEELMNL